MKKAIIGFTIIVILTITTGCFNSGKKVTCTYNYKDDKDNVNETLITTIKDEKVTLMKRTINYNLSKYDENEQKEFFNLIKKTFAEFESDAFTSTTEMKDNKLTTDIKINFDKATESEITKYTPNYTELLTKNYTVEEYIKKMAKLKYNCE